MRYYLHLLLILSLLYPTVLDAQENIAVRKKEFKKGDSGFKSAWKHVMDGDSYFVSQGKWYSQAFEEYIKALSYNDFNAELNYKTGASALFSDNKEKASEYLLKALELKPDVADDALLLTGRALQYAGKYEEAVEKYNEYLKADMKKSKMEIANAMKGIEECNSIVGIIKDTLRIGISNLGVNINSNTDDYSEQISADGTTIYFASRREMLKSNDRYKDSKFDENIFVSTSNAGSWGLPMLAGKNLTTKYCEAPLYLNKTGNRLYIYIGYERGGDILVSEYKKGQWRSPKPFLSKINTKGVETSFAFSPSGNEIYFVSDKGKENIGGKDIYMIKKLNEKKWSKPQNLGSLINTKYDEESVRFSASGDTLWFSSKGHNSMGGYDIFYSVKNDIGIWDSVSNYGYPLNTPWDEIFYTPSPVDDSAFYFVSNRSGGFGGLDIYRGRLLPPEPEPIEPPKPDTVVVRDTVVVVKEAPVKEQIIFLVGTIRDSETNDPVSANIYLIDIATNQSVDSTKSSEEDGSFRVRLPEKKSYMVSLKAKGFLSDMKTISIPDSYEQDIYNLDASLLKVNVGKKVVLNNILFETGKSILTPSSYEELDRLYKILQDNPLMRIEISGHTDKTGSESLNFRLSESRAKAVVEYLVKKGIDSSRMEFRGYGSLQPIADNATAEGRTKNRRVEFKILEF